MEPRLSEQVSVRFDKPTFIKLSVAAAAERITIAEQVRRIVQAHYREESARMGMPVVEEAIRRVIEPHIEGLITHTGVAAGTSAWLAKALVNLLTQIDPDEAWDQAVARAKAGLRRSMKGAEAVNDDQD
jgi:hypothetical protein